MIQQIILQISFYQRTNVDMIVFRITFNTIVWTAPIHPISFTNIVPAFIQFTFRTNVS